MFYTLIRYNELCHHGVKGQKWGVRRYQNEDGSLTEAGKKRLDTYVKKEGSIIAKRRLKELKTESKQIAKQANRFNNNLDKYGQDSKKTIKSANKYIDTKAKAITKDDIAKAEVKKILSMTLEDVAAEKKELGKVGVRSALQNIGSGVITGLVGSPVTPVFIPNIKAYKTNMRVDQKTQDAIKIRAYCEAAEDIFGPSTVSLRDKKEST